MIVLQIMAPYIVERGLSLLEQDALQTAAFGADLQARLLEIIPLVRHILPIMHRCHLAAFYINGLFYHMAKRVLCIYYVSKHLHPPCCLFAMVGTVYNHFCSFSPILPDSGLDIFWVLNSNNTLKELCGWRLNQSHRSR